MTQSLDYDSEKINEWCLKQIIYGKVKYLRPDFVKRCLAYYADQGQDMLLKGLDRDELHHRIKFEPWQAHLGPDYKLPQGILGTKELEPPRPQIPIREKRESFVWDRE